MFPNGRFWSSQIRSDFIPATRRISEVFLTRFIPTFASAESEAESRSQQVYDELLAQPSDGDGDLAECAETAEDAGNTYYIWMKELEQGVLNACAMFLYHLFEQQMVLLLRRELLSDAEISNAKLFKCETAQERIGACGIDVARLASWSTIVELRLVANAVKHGEGRSSDELFQLASDLFEPPLLKAIGGGAGLPSRSSVFTPLLGNDLYVTQERIEMYVSALTDFWKELAARMEAR